jgi:mRNA-degrading endonuclease RelE of RelBE toxin-antitoxin system
LKKTFLSVREFSDKRYNLVKSKSETSKQRFLPPHPGKCQKESDMAYVTKGDRGGKVLVFDGYKYQKNRTRGNTIHWRCWRETCRAPLQTSDCNVDDNAPNIQVLTISKRFVFNMKNGLRIS